MGLTREVSSDTFIIKYISVRVHKYGEKGKMSKEEKISFRRFKLVRYEDETGISGTGKIAEGVQFSSGKCVIAWIREIPSVTVYDTVDQILSIHGHDGKTELRWIDGPSLPYCV